MSEYGKETFAHIEREIRYSLLVGHGPNEIACAIINELEAGHEQRALRKDAERYRWIREHGAQEAGLGHAEYDAKVDSIIASEPLA